MCTLLDPSSFYYRDLEGKRDIERERDRDRDRDRGERERNLMIRRQKKEKTKHNKVRSC